MRAWFLVVAMVPLLALANPASINNSDPGVEVRLELLRPGPYYVNGRLPVKLTLALDGRLWGRVTLRQPNLKGAMVINDPRQEFDKDTEKQVSHPKEILTRRFEIYPRQEGTLDLGPVEMQLVYYDRPSDKYRQVEVTSAPLSIEVRRPPGWPDEAEPLVSSQLTLSQSVAGAEGDLKVGEAVTLTYTIMASGVDAMLLPSFVLQELEGTSRYLKPPQFHNYRNSKGEPVGRRTEQVTYIAQRPGAFSIGPLRVDWWNLVDSRLESAAAGLVSWRVDGVLPHWLYQMWYRQRVGLLSLLALALVLSVTGVALIARRRASWDEARRLRRSYWCSFEQQDAVGMSEILAEIAAGAEGKPGPLRERLDGEARIALEGLFLYGFGQGGAALTRTQAKRLLKAVTHGKPKSKTKAFSLGLNTGMEQESVF